MTLGRWPPLSNWKGNCRDGKRDDCVEFPKSRRPALKATSLDSGPKRVGPREAAAVTCDEARFSGDGGEHLCCEVRTQQDRHHAEAKATIRAEVSTEAKVHEDHNKSEHDDSSILVAGFG